MNRDIMSRLVAGIKAAVPDKVSQIILYGSVARGDASDESDIDVAMIVRAPLNAEDEDNLSYTIVSLNLDYDCVFSVIDIQEDVYLVWKDYSPFYRNISTEGVVLWTAGST